jgi:hypothetical protein
MTVPRTAVLPRPFGKAEAQTEPRDATLLDLVSAVSEQTEDDGEVVDTVLDLLRSGRVRLTGNFRGQRF